MTEDTDALMAEIEAQEKRLVFTRFRHDDAWELGSILVSLGHERSLPITIDITRGEQQLFHAALAGTAPNNDDWVARKARTVRRYGVSSFLVGLRHRSSGTPFETRPWANNALYAAHGGCFPITIADSGVIGTVTVSGLAQEDDHALVVEAIELFLAQQR
ncbi:heme-degrading domain-containing protein [Parafrigoribacterium humi]|uniref:heme-degrading domain-containing protein n=1 Tax=Parafrigoribacterium humi TaxID=3144664 RepID=UPI0032EFD54A